MRRPDAIDRPARALSRERPQATSHPADRQQRHRPARMLAANPGEPDSPLFPSGNGTPLSSDTVAWLITKYATMAATRCPSLTGQRVTPHTLRHTAAMFLREAAVDISVIALWLGHESRLNADLHAHRPRRQTTCTRPHDTNSWDHQPQPTARCPARLPGKPLIIPSGSGGCSTPASTNLSTPGPGSTRSKTPADTARSLRLVRR